MGVLSKGAEHITALRRELNCLRVPERIQFRLCVLTYHYLSGTASSHLAETTEDHQRRCTFASTVYCNVDVIVPSTQSLNTRQPCLSGGGCTCLERSPSSVGVWREQHAAVVPLGPKDSCLQHFIA